MIKCHTRKKREVLPNIKQRINDYTDIGFHETASIFDMITVAIMLLPSFAIACCVCEVQLNWTQRESIRCFHSELIMCELCVCAHRFSDLSTGVGGCVTVTEGGSVSSLKVAKVRSTVDCSFTKLSCPFSALSPPAVRCQVRGRRHGVCSIKLMLIFISHHPNW